MKGLGTIICRGRVRTNQGITDTYLVKDPIWTVLNDLHQTLLARPAGRSLDVGDAELAQPCLRDNGEQISPVERRLLIQSPAEKPVCCWVDAQHGDGEAVDLSIGIRGIELDRKAAARSSAFSVVVKSQRRRVLKNEVSGGLEGEQQAEEQGSDGRHSDSLLCSKFAVEEGLYCEQGDSGNKLQEQ